MKNFDVILLSSKKSLNQISNLLLHLFFYLSIVGFLLGIMVLVHYVIIYYPMLFLIVAPILIFISFIAYNYEESLKELKKESNENF